MNMLAQQNIECSVTLLPPNATKFEKAVEQSIKYNVYPNILAGFKFNQPSSKILLSLSWEYSLAQIKVDDFKDRILQGLQFHRLKGTPYSLRMALSWYGLTGVVIEEEEPGKHFAEFQIGFDSAPENFNSETVVNAAKLAAPLRSRLSRMYNKDCDVRHFVLNQSDWGDLLSDHSGIYISSGSPKLSFGRKIFCDTSFSDYLGKYSAKSQKYTHTANEDRFRLSYGLLDDSFHFQYYDNDFYQQKTVVNFDFIGDKLPAKTIRPTTLARAMVVLSESKLGELNSCYSGSYSQLTEDGFTLSFSFLSEHKSTNNNVLIDKRLWSSKKADFVVPFVAETSGMQYQSSSVLTGILNSETTKHCADSTTYCGAYLGNNTWHDHRHFDVSWSDQNFYSQMT